MFSFMVNKNYLKRKDIKDSSLYNCDIDRCHVLNNFKILVNDKPYTIIVLIRNDSYYR